MSWRKDGSRYPVEVHLQLSHYGENRAYVAIINDLTERKLAEAEQERARAFLQTVVDGFPEALMVINRDYTIALANRTVRELAGISESSNASCPRCYAISHHLGSPCGGDAHPCPLQQVFESAKPVHVNHVHRDSQGQDCGGPHLR